MTTQQENFLEKMMVSKNDKKSMKDWESVIRMGFWRYILLEGIIWGLLVGILTLFMVEGFTNWGKFLRYVLIFIVGGIIGNAPSMWFFNNWRYKTFKKRFPDEI